MKLDHCEYDLETKFVDPCCDCRRTRFSRKIPIHFGPFVLYVTYLYEMRNCFQGFTGGDFLHAMSLLPGEEQEVEIIQKSKYERALHEQSSTESEFEQEFINTLRLETSNTLDFNTATSASGSVSFFGMADASASASMSLATHFGVNTFAETITKASMSVSNHYEVSVDTKTEIENQYRSLRKISNPNKCRVVTYIFKQLSKKYEIDIVLLGIRFDLIQHVPLIHKELLPYHLVEPKFAVAVQHPRVVANVNPHEARLDANAQQSAFKASSHAQTPQLHVNVQDAFMTHLYRDITLAKELDAEAFLAKVDSLKLDKVQKTQVLAAFNELTKRKENQPGFVIYHTEYCVRTNSIVAEPKVSHCSICACEECNACGEHNEDEAGADADIKALEMEKLKTEIELLKKQIEKV